jgi:hypothetical protein
MHNRRSVIWAFSNALAAICLLAAGIAISLGGAQKADAANSCIGTPTIDAAARLLADGSGSFVGPDPTFAGVGDPGRGNDANATNGIVRTNDTITYHGEVNLIRCDSSNTRLTFVLSNTGAGSNVSWTVLPPACLTGGVAPLSSISADRKTLVCNFGLYEQGTVAIVEPVAKVLATALHGDTVSMTMSATADGANTVTPATINTRVSTAPKVDLIKTTFKGENMTGPLGEAGRLVTYAVTLVAGPGSEPLQGTSVSINDSFTGGGSGSYANNQNSARLYTWGPNLAAGACNANGINDLIASEPFGKSTLTGISVIGVDGTGMTVNSGTTNATADSGTWSCAQTSPAVVTPRTAAQTFTISITAADLSLNTSPSVKANGGSIVATDSYLISGYVKIWFPETDFLPSSGASTGYNTTNTVATFAGTGRSGSANVEPTLTNNVALFACSAVNIPGGSGCVNVHGSRSSFRGPALSETNTMKAYPGDVLPFAAETYVAASEAGGLTHGLKRVDNEGQCLKIDPAKAEFAGFSKALFNPSSSISTAPPYPTTAIEWATLPTYPVGLLRFPTAPYWLLNPPYRSWNTRPLL